MQETRVPRCQINKLCPRRLPLPVRDPEDQVGEKWTIRCARKQDEVFAGTSRTLPPHSFAYHPPELGMDQLTIRPSPPSMLTIKPAGGERRGLPVVPDKDLDRYILTRTPPPCTGQNFGVFNTCLFASQ